MRSESGVAEGVGAELDRYLEWWARGATFRGVFGVIALALGGIVTFIQSAEAGRLSQMFLGVGLVAGAALLVVGPWAFVVLLHRRRDTESVLPWNAASSATPQTSQDSSTFPQPAPRITVVRWREAYRVGEVDAFLARVSARAVTSAEVANVRFSPVRLQPGYAMGEVDSYLASAEAELRAAGR